MNNLARIDLGRAGWIHIGYDGRHSHRGVEQAEQRKAGQVDLAGRDAVVLLNQIDLRIEHPMFVQDALRGTGAATGEDNGCLIASRRHVWFKVANR